jgi:Ca-activated chloride channel homolog
MNSVMNKLISLAMFIAALSGLPAAQVLNFPGSGNRFGSLTALDAIQSGQMSFNIFTINTQDSNVTSLQTPSDSVSKFDLKAPWRAQREYQKGYQLLMRKDLQAAIAHLSNATGIYPSFVAAHNALGTAYLNLNQNEQARDEFAKAVGLDDHLPSSYLNLGCAQLALKEYPGAEQSLRKASSIAPLDLQLLLALAYGEFENHDYPAVLETSRQVHDRKHQGAALVHYFAAGAWEAQDNLAAAQHEMETLLREDPKSPSVDEFRQILEDIKKEETHRADLKAHPAQPVTFSFDSPAAPTAEQASLHAQQVLQDVKERNQIAEAEAAPDPTCADCAAPRPAESVKPTSNPATKPRGINFPGPTFRSAVDEVAVFFAATDHGKSVTNLTASDIGLRDDKQPPNAILGFRNESQLPLRLGLIMDISNSVTSRFSFEQGAATKFLGKVVTGTDDLAFVIGVNNSVLLVQDFTANLALTSRAVGQLAPGGGTALWDAVSFAADKLASRAEVQPVARVLVVISDGKDNSSSVSLKEAIANAQRREVAVYTVSTRDQTDEDPSDILGDHALRTLSELTGGAAFVPGSLRRLNGSLADLQQVIRGRYLVSYRPASFQRDGHYRAIDIIAQKDGHKLKVYARKGYYALAEQPASSDR